MDAEVFASESDTNSTRNNEHSGAHECVKRDEPRRELKTLKTSQKDMIVDIRIGKKELRN